ncbi:hypothetical protein CRG98_039802 [Punica granatum]|uniref:Reverse transcriptase Ty1/copia-type domain-containing protein n=1 Tax=Punica granatum TaxID=22663 RepID=A0A2I0I705_PUNGR|nr:hypothetical protein CRG98_039802 [Punica granatum]
MDPLPNANRAHSMAAHDETQRQIAQGRESNAEVVGFAAKIANDAGGVSYPNFGSKNRGDSKPRGRPYQSGPSQSRSAQYNHGQWRPNQSFNSSPSNYTAAQAHAEQPADLSKLAHLSEAQLQQLVSMVSRDDAGPAFQGENFGPTIPNPVQGASIRPIEPNPDEIPHGEPSLDGGLRDTGPRSAQISSAEPSRPSPFAQPISPSTQPCSAQIPSAEPSRPSSSAQPNSPASPPVTVAPNPLVSAGLLIAPASAPSSTDPTEDSIARNKASRNIRQPSWLKDFVSHTARCLDYTSPPPIKSPTPSYSPAHTNQVCRLRKSLYGLRQASRNWYSKFAAALIQYCFQQSEADHSLFTYSHAEIVRSSFGLFLNQRKYALDILTEAGMLGSRPAYFPMEQQHQLSQDSGDQISDPGQYRHLIGRLLYLTITRPELCYPVHILSQFLQDPRQGHWDAAMRVLRYLKQSPGQGIFLRPTSLSLTAYCDADWVSCPMTRRSLTGYFITLGGSSISWKTKKQTTVSKSSAEAEYRAMAATISELLWLRCLLSSLGIYHMSADAKQDAFPFAHLQSYIQMNHGFPGLTGATGIRIRDRDLV